ncbi:MAG TPA: exodeoxyribonuclease VII small subunit [Candidatus Nitrosotenuis sp.]|nr:exodeoxyribonuclease VII small subunit [Candidatus Nitrosotenuis sp.]
MSEPTYEQSLDRLKQVVELLEQGNLGLEESMRLFEEGVGLARRCQEKLREVEEQVRILMADSGEGEVDDGRAGALTRGDGGRNP